MNVSEIPPDLRLPWLAPSGLDTTHGIMTAFADGGECLTCAASHGSATLPEGSAAANALESAVDDLIRRITDSGPIAASLRLVLVLAAWDEEFRAADLYSGNVYLASEWSAQSLAQAAGVHDIMLGTPAVLCALLTLLFQAELIYRFPVAIKFRGTFGVERQFRLNCWGRRLASRIAGHDSAAQFSISIRRRLAAHLQEHHDLYAKHMALLRDLAAFPAGAAWESARRLPVGVLI